MNHEKTIAIARILTVCAFLAMTGCASLPSPEVMKSETTAYQLPKLPEKGKAVVYVVRPSPLGGIVRFNVFVNDQEPSSEMSYTRSNEYIYFSVLPGEHRIYSKAETWAETLVSAKAGDIIFIQQEPTIGIIMARNNLLRLEDYVGKYHVKMLKPGTTLKTSK